MSPRRSRGSPGARVPDEQLLGLLLERSAASQAELELRGLDPRCAERIGELRAWLERCQREGRDCDRRADRTIGAPVATGAARVAERALARTTRSPWARVRRVPAQLAAAAAMLAALGAWAWFGMPERAGGEAPPQTMSVARSSFDRARGQRFLAGIGTVPYGAEDRRSGFASPALEAVLAARARVIAGGDLPAWASDLASFERADEHAAAVWVEMLLDQAARSGEAPDGLAACLRRLRARAPADAGDLSGSPDLPDLPDLTGLALARARALGIAGAGPDTGVERSTDPLDRDWLAALWRAAKHRPSPELSRWLALEPERS